MGKHRGFFGSLGAVYKMDKQNLYILAVAILVITYLPKIEPQSIAPPCIIHEDCAVPVKEGYCNVNYACIQGRCYEDQIPCPEKCDSGKDEDMDNLIDCKDPDCYNSPLCSCSLMSYTTCVVGTCYCPDGRSPKWFFEQEECRCV